MESKTGLHQIQNSKSASTITFSRDPHHLYDFQLTKLRSFIHRSMSKLSSTKICTKSDPILAGHCQICTSQSTSRHKYMIHSIGLVCGLSLPSDIVIREYAVHLLKLIHVHLSMATQCSQSSSPTNSLELVHSHSFKKRAPCAVLRSRCRDRYQAQLARGIKNMPHRMRVKLECAYLFV